MAANRLELPQEIFSFSYTLRNKSLLQTLEVFSCKLRYTLIISLYKCLVFTFIQPKRFSLRQNGVRYKLIIRSSPARIKNV